MIRLLCLLCLLASVHILHAGDTISLRGNWQVRLSDSSISSISLPGTTDLAGIGDQNVDSSFGHLQRRFKYIGKAVYSRWLNIPSDWENQPLGLYLERVLWKSTVYINGKPVGSESSLSTPHHFSIDGLVPGQHLIEIEVDNSMIFSIGDKGHAYTEHTQSVWNGIVGDIFIYKQPAAPLHQVMLFPDQATRTLKLHFFVKQPPAGTSQLKLFIKDHKSGRLLQQEKLNILPDGPNEHTIRLKFKPATWDEFNPALYSVTLTDNNNRRVFSHSIGFRSLATDQHKIIINNNPVFIRGNLENAQFPLQGHPSTEVADWKKILKVHKEQGFNQVRFHSWCPPKAAFEAADEIGIYLQPEIIWIDSWMNAHPGLGYNPSADAFVKEEMNRIINIYGNHPSFVFFAIGNELGNSNFDTLSQWIGKIKEQYPNRLYAASSARSITKTDDFIVTHQLDPFGATYGLGANGTSENLEMVYGKSDIPVIAHELGQFPVYPIWKQLEQYNGVYSAANLELAHKMAYHNGLQNRDSIYARSGIGLQQLLYKELLEKILRTPSAAGYQLLGMQDYLGQGEALVGWLDAFYQPKYGLDSGFIQLSNAAIVPLAKFSSFVWRSEDLFEAAIYLANYSNKSIRTKLQWKLYNPFSNLTIASGTSTTTNFASGKLSPGGTIKTSLNAIHEPGKYRLEISLPESGIRNYWDLWIYPNQPILPQYSIKERSELNEATLDWVKQGGKLLFYGAGNIREKYKRPLHYQPLFWSSVYFSGQANSTLGAWIDKNHPVFRQFPTDFFPGRQWQTITKGNAVVVSSFFPEHSAMVEPITDFHINELQASLFEFGYGKGKVLFCGYDLDTIQNPVAQQLRYSMLNYLQENNTKPAFSLSRTVLDSLFHLNGAVLKPELTPDILTILPAHHIPAISAPTKWKAELDAVIKIPAISLTITGADSVIANDRMKGWYSSGILIQASIPPGKLGTIEVLLGNPHEHALTAELDIRGRKSTITIEPHSKQSVKQVLMREDSGDGKLIVRLTQPDSEKLVIESIKITEKL
jgi:beta-galactosidase